MKENQIQNLYLHVGMSKTATSSIQDTLYANRQILEKNNFFYSGTLPKNQSDTFRMLFSDATENHHTSVKHGLDTKKIQAINDRSAENIGKELGETKCSNAIYSGESISMLKKPGLEKLKSFFQKIAPRANIYILISTRNPIDFINSWSQQRARTAVETKAGFCYKNKLEKLVTIFGKENIVAYKFEEARKNEFGPVGHFLSLIGLQKNIIGDFNIINSNLSLSDKAVDIIDYVNNAAPMFSEGQISTARIHLDYTHFYGLSGAKFQLGKDYFESNYSLDQLSKSCGWLEKNFGIEYTVQGILEEPPLIIYDQTFSEEIKSAYPFLTPVLKKLTHEYVKNRLQARTIDRVSKKTLKKLLRWMTSNHKDTEKKSLEDIIKQQRAIISIDTKHRDQLLKRFRGDDIRAGQFLRDVAIFLEHYEMIEESMFFMGKAKMYYPNEKSINKKLKEYQAVTENK